MIILAIETSCDETAVAIAEFKSGKAKVLSDLISSQVKMHSKYGGVVPSLASRMHLKNIAPVLSRALRLAKIGKSKIDYIAVTNGPGLAPALMIGVSAAKTLSYALNKPLVGVHHIEGHIYANWLTELKVHKVHKVGSYDLWQPKFPILCLIVSGGHTQLILMKKDLNYKVIGETLDDATGEAFDKVAKLLNLGYPGGPLIEKIAKKGDKNKYKFTRPMINSGDYNFSFSGLKTAVLYKWKLESPIELRTSFGILNLENKKEKLKLQNSDAGFNSAKFHSDFRQDSKFKADIAASFQQAVIDVLVSKTIKAAKKHKIKNVILGGGVSANKELQKQLKETINKEIPNTQYSILNTNLSTDNALMIAVAAYYRIVNNKGVGNWKSVKADANLKLK
jgi:N6-L-threonylcarbamoyladenine synthase